MRFATLDEWLDWQDTLHPQKIDLGLERVRVVLVALGMRRPEFRVLTVAGTNGKGSTVNLLANILSAGGYRVGTFTSPHLFHYRERIRLLNRHPDDHELIAWFETIDQARGDTTLTYFEFGFIAAILAFAASRVHVAVLEVGLGGRLDAVNALDPDAAMVVSVGLDHMSRLGDNVEAIGFEKAGVFRSGVPAVVADPNPPHSVIGHAHSLDAKLRVVGKDFQYKQSGSTSCWAYRDWQWDLTALPLPSGEAGYLLANAAGALALLSSVSHQLPIPVAAIRAGLGQPAPRGRLERHQIDATEWIFDVAHNPAGARELARALMPVIPGRTLAIVAVLADKDVPQLLGELISSVDVWWVAEAETTRTAQVADVAEQLRRLGPEDVHISTTIGAAVDAARNLATAQDRVVVFGSFHTVGPALMHLELY
jgi:dihydrofolate synthase/folylpolyglutamate synthase